MGKNPVTVGDEVIIQHEGLQQILDALNDEGFEAIGPRVRNDTVIYDNLKNIADLPIGLVDVQSPGGYRLEKSDAPTLFGFVVGPHSLKKYLHPPLIRLWRAQATDGGFQVVDTEETPPKYAFIGVRSCELSALAAHDNVFNTDRFSDPLYNSRREQAFIVAVNCVRPGGTCFCDSMNTGPKAQFGFDIALTEVLDNGRHFFLAEAGSAKGAAILDGVAHRTAGKEETDLARRLLEQASANMGRVLDNSNIKALFYENFEHNRWAKVAERCLTCGNCTLVCPTCFCSTIEDVGSLNGAYAERWRKWDSCFTTEFSYMHGGSARASERSRYRQWLTHKLATWWDQFGTSGCVGCGRCITWCPVGIDITEEKKAILG